MKILSNLIAYIAMFMAMIALFRYIFDGSLEHWVWWRSLLIAAAVGVFNVWKNNKKGAYDDHKND